MAVTKQHQFRSNPYAPVMCKACGQGQYASIHLYHNDHPFLLVGVSPYCAYVQSDNTVCGGSEGNHPPYCSCSHAKSAHPKIRVRNGVAPGTPCRVDGCGCQTWFPWPADSHEFIGEEPGMCWYISPSAEDRCGQPRNALIHELSINAFEDYLPLSAVRVVPGEYEIKSRDGRVLWRMEGASLADWVCASCNGYSALSRERKVIPEQIVYSTAQRDPGFRKHLIEQLTAMGEGVNTESIKGGSILLAATATTKGCDKCSHVFPDGKEVHFEGCSVLGKATYWGL